MRTSICLTMILLPLSVHTQTNDYIVTTLAGNGDDLLRDGAGNKASFSSSLGHITTDANDNVYVLDMLGAIRMITTDGNVNTIFGQIIYDTEGNSKEIGQWLNGADGICIDKKGNIFVSQRNRHMVIKITDQKTITDYAGDNGYNGADDGAALSSGFNDPKGICIDNNGNIYVADSRNGNIRKISADGKTVSTLAGKGVSSGFETGTGKSASFSDLNSIAVDSKGNVYVPQNGRGSCIAKISPTGVVTMFAGDIDKLGTGQDGTGTSAHFLNINAIAIDNEDNIYVAENCRVRKITPAGVVTTIAGINEKGYRDAEGSKARFGYLAGITTDSKGNVYVSDFEGFRIRKISKQ